MRHPFRFILLLLLVCAAYIGYQFLPTSYEAVQVEHLIKKDGKALVVSNIISAGENIQNETPYPIKISFGDKVKASLAPGGKTQLLSLTEQKNKKQHLKVQSGMIRFDVKKTWPPTQFTIRTPSAVAGVRGTKFRVDVTQSSTNVILPEGRLHLQSTSTGQEVELEQGQAVKADDLLFAEVRQLTPEEIQRELKEFLPHFFDPSPIHIYKEIVERHYGGHYYFEKWPNGWHLNLADNHQVQDLKPLIEIPLYSLDLSNTPIADLSPVSNMSIMRLNLEGSKVEDLSPLNQSLLRELYLGNTNVSDVSPLRGLALTTLTLWNTPVSNISPLRQMPLHWLALADSRVSDLSPLENMTTLRILTLSNAPVKKIEPLANLPLEKLLVTPANLEGEWRKTLRKIHSLKVLGSSYRDFKNNTPPEAFFKEHPENRPPLYR